jgi:hypothetical protein
MTQTEETIIPSYSIPLRILTIQQILNSGESLSKLPKDITDDIIMYTKWDAMGGFISDPFSPTCALGCWNNMVYQMCRSCQDLDLIGNNILNVRNITLTREDLIRGEKTLNEILLWIRPYIFDSIVNLNGFMEYSLYWAVKNDIDIELIIKHLNVKLFCKYLNTYNGTDAYIMRELFNKRADIVELLFKYHKELLTKSFELISNNRIFMNLIPRNKTEHLDVLDRQAHKIIALEHFSGNQVVVDFLQSIQ